MVHILIIVEPIWPMLQKVSKTLTCIVIHVYDNSVVVFTKHFVTPKFHIKEICIIRYVTCNYGAKYVCLCGQFVN